MKMSLMESVYCSVDDGPSFSFPEPNDYVIAGLCEENFGPNEKSGFFESPEYPEEYYAKEDCLFFFEAEEDEVIQITFDKLFNVEEDDNCQFDQVEIHDGRYGFSPLLARLCGTVAPDPVTSSTNFLWVGFFTDSDVEEEGFRAYYKFIPNPNLPVTKPPRADIDTPAIVGPEDCFFKLDENFDGEINSSSLINALIDQGRYPTSKVDCTWEINVPENYKILLEFQEFSLTYVNECQHNRIIVYDRYALDNRKVSEFCSTTAPPVMTKTNRAYLRFVATKTIGGNEWKLIYTAYRDKPCNTTLSFECGQHICIDHELRCNGRPNCWNYPSDEENCHANPPLLQGKIDAALGAVMTFILLLTFITIVLSCRHSWLRTKHKAREARLRRTVERSAVQYLMDTGEGPESSELATMSPPNFQRYKRPDAGLQSINYLPPEGACSSVPRSRNSEGSNLSPHMNDYLEQLMDRRSSTGQNISLFTWDTVDKPSASSSKNPKTVWNVFV